MARRRIAVVALAACALIAGTIGWGGSASAGDASTAKERGPKLELMKTRFGRILVNGKGRALYLFTADTGQSNCYGDCAHAWPPYLVKRRPRAGDDVRAGLIGTVQRSDGSIQATYAGHPLYYYISDNEPGEVLCQAVNEFGGYWYVLRASGKAVR
jgi:predicted lipoprotein with Yx(FWY)xxD motif